MDQKKLIKIVDTIVKKRLKTVIREVVKEEIKDQVLQVLLENIRGKQNQSTMLSKIDDDIEQQRENVVPNNVVPKKKRYTDNNIINEILNETNLSVGNTPPVASQPQSQPSSAFITSDKITEGQPVITNNNTGIIPEGANPIVEHVPRDLSRFPEHIQKALTRNYSSVLKATDEITKQRRGMM